jgi:hypothetical protein
MNYSLRYIKRCKILFTFDTCISVSLFRMKYSYRDFSRYVKDFRRWLPDIPKSFYVRLYVDASVLQEPSFIELFDANYPKLEIVLYQFDDYLDDDGIHHDGFFGALTRFLVLYNKPALPKTVKYVWVSDLDLPTFIFSYQNLLDLKMNKARLSYLSWSYYDKEWVSETIRYPILAGKIISKTSIKYNFSDFETYLSDLIKGKYDDIKNAILQRLGKEGEKHYMKNVKFVPYGLDELFCNIYLTKEFEKHRRLIYYDINLSRISYKYDIPHLQQLKKLEAKTWYAKPTPEIRHRLLELNEEVYQFMQSQKVDEHRIKVCLNDFQKYKGYIDRKLSPMWGLTVPVVVNAGKRE